VSKRALSSQDRGPGGAFEAKRNIPKTQAVESTMLELYCSASGCLRAMIREVLVEVRAKHPRGVDATRQ